MKPTCPTHGYGQFVVGPLEPWPHDWYCIRCGHTFTPATPTTPYEASSTPSRAIVLAALEHENFCRWPDHRDCCHVTVEDCTCNVDSNLWTLTRLGWLQLQEDNP